MQEIDTLIHARWLLPVEPQGVLHEHWSVAVHNGRIVDLLPTAEARARYHARDTHERPAHVVMPGLVNAHTHAAMTLLRGLADDLPLAAWLNDHIWPAEARWVSAEFVRDGTELAVAELLRGGVTCIQDMYFFPDVSARVCAHLGMRACIGLVVIDFPTAWAREAQEYITKGMELRDQHKSDPLLSFAFAPHAPYTVAEETLTRIRTLADELELPIHMHVHETAHEVEQSLAAKGERPLARLRALGLLSPAMMAVHMTQLTEEEIALVASTGTHVIHCPESNLKLASGFCPVGKLLAAGVNVALGTDGAASNNDLDMFGELRTATLLAKGVAGDPTVLPAVQALRMATINGARALGLEAEIGSIERGKWADLIAIEIAPPEGAPLYNPLSHLVYAASRRDVTDTWIAGRHLLRERQLVAVDEAALAVRVEDWRNRIVRHNGTAA